MPQPPDWFFENDEYTDRHKAFDEGFDICLQMFSEQLGAAGNWYYADGSESWEGDASMTVTNVLKAANVYDEDTGKVARHPQSQG